MKIKKYTINTVQDMIDCTNESNLDNFLFDLRSVIETAHALQLLYKAKMKSKGFTWIDDGKHNIKINIK